MVFKSYPHFTNFSLSLFFTSSYDSMKSNFIIAKEGKCWWPLCNRCKRKTPHLRKICRLKPVSSWIFFQPWGRLSDSWKSETVNISRYRIDQRLPKQNFSISPAMIRSKDKEVMELKAKIAQLLAVMPSVPSESFCLPPCSSTGSSMLRLNDSPSLQGPSSPMSHKRLGGSPLISQLQSLGVFTSSSNQTLSQSSVVVPHSGGQSALMVQGPNNNNNASNLDPNATVYTPKNLVNGTEAWLSIQSDWYQQWWRVFFLFNTSLWPAISLALSLCKYSIFSFLIYWRLFRVRFLFLTFNCNGNELTYCAHRSGGVSN